MIFISAGHHLKDPGAVANGKQENTLAIELRGLIVNELKKLGASFITDKDTETLAQYLERIKTGSGSVVCEVHFDAAGPTATGTTVIIPDDATQHEKDLGGELAVGGSEILGIKNRGVWPESKTARGRLGLMRESGMNVLIEVCFITNRSDLAAYEKNKAAYAAYVASVLKRYDDKVE